MKHCSKCGENYVDKFDRCFRCDVELEAGELPTPSAPEAGTSEALAEAGPDAIEAGKSFGKLGLQVAVLAGFLLGGAWFFSHMFGSNVDLRDGKRYLLRGGSGGVFGVARTLEERKNLAAEYAVTLPVIEAGSEMLVWRVVEQRMGVRYLPEIRYALRDEKEGRLVVLLGPSRSYAPGAFQLGRKLRRVAKKDGEEEDSSVVTLHVSVMDAEEGQIRWGLPAIYGGDKDEVGRFDWNDSVEDRILRGKGGKILQILFFLVGIGAILVLGYVLFA